MVMDVLRHYWKRKRHRFDETKKEGVCDEKKTGIRSWSILVSVCSGLDGRCHFQRLDEMRRGTGAVLLVPPVITLRGCLSLRVWRGVLFVGWSDSSCVDGLSEGGGGQKLGGAITVEFMKEAEDGGVRSMAGM
ncbi:hypothetical protein Tco_1008782 [Tanacetum coccineum]